MPEPLYLSRARLRSDAPISALHRVLTPSDDGQRMSVGHKLVWTLFGDARDRTRDFLWREAEPGLFYTLSHRPPEDRHGMFELAEPKPFAPRLSPGDRLTFALRANATTAKKMTGKDRGQPCDVVMNALFELPREQRAAARPSIAECTGTEWLVRQGERHGFRLVGEALANDKVPGGAPSVVTGYRTLRLDRGRGAEARIGVIDFAGTLEVTDPTLFVEGIGHGLGRSKAFGCGLMLIRRAAER